MEKTDARKLSPQNQEQLRVQAVRLRKKGKKFIEIAEIIGVHRNTVSQWWKSYQADGQKGIKSKRRGRQYGDLRSMSIEQEKEIQKLICDKTPDQYKLTFALWRRQAVQELIKHQLGIYMPIRTVGEYLKRWGFTPQEPLRRAYQQQAAKVEKLVK
ncbi:MAG: winged helix-turn-helix domain-containing protein [Ignavibacteria bacterium]|jgi:transposase